MGGAINSDLLQWIAYLQEAPRGFSLLIVKPLWSSLSALNRADLVIHRTLWTWPCVTSKERSWQMLQLLPWSLILGETSHHVMKKPKPHYGEAHVERHWGLLLIAIPAHHLGNGYPPALVKASDDSSPAWHLNCSLMRDPDPRLPS